MKSINLKLVMSNFFIVFFAIVMVSVPVTVNQYRTECAAFIDSAQLKINQGHADINRFLKEPMTIVNSSVSYILTHPLDRDSMENFFEEMIHGNEMFSELYYASSLPVRNGGFFYSNDRWEPPADYDQTTRSWYKAGFGAEKIGVSDPYLDSVTGQMVAAVARAVRRNSTVDGVVGLDIQLDELNDIVSPIRVTKSGASFLLDKTGKYFTNEDDSKLMTVNFFEEYHLGEHKLKINDSEVFFLSDNGKGRYFAARIISEETGWIFVTTGPTGELFASVQSSIITTIVLVLIAMGISALVAILVAKPIVKPVIVVDKAVNAIASGNADLTQRIKVTSQDEIGSMVLGFNKFSEKLQSIIRDIKLCERELAGAGHELECSSQDTASSITQIIANISSMHGQIESQNMSVTETAGAVNEIASNIDSLERMIAKQSLGVSQASAAVEQMIGNIRSVNTSVEKMVDSFENLQNSSETGIQKQQAVNRHLVEIEGQSKMLQEANQTIASIASQTNLLAMNAAIEAAHAGELGKGFSVVADEIRKLSETSTVQSKKIGMQLKDIKNAINMVVTESSESTEAFSSVSSKLEETDMLVRQIKSAMAEQNEGSLQISQALHSMNDSTMEVKAAGEEMAEGNKSILDEIRRLQETSASMTGSMAEMSDGARRINETGTTLNEVAGSMQRAIKAIGNQIDQFTV